MAATQGVRGLNFSIDNVTDICITPIDNKYFSIWIKTDIMKLLKNFELEDLETEIKLRKLT